MEPESGLRFACSLNGKGEAKARTWKEIGTWDSQQASLWIHLDRLRADSQQWLRRDSGLNSLVAEALLETETRPRIMVLDDSLFLTLRGVKSQSRG